MNKNVKLLLYIITFAGSAVLGNALWRWYESTTPPAVAAKAAENAMRPAFTLPDLAGRIHNVSEWNGKVLVVNFWATWCPPCRREIPDFMELQQTYANRGVQFVGIAIDNAAKVQDYADTLGIEYPILVGEEQAIKVAKQYGNRFGALPYTAIVDRNGRIINTYRGEVSREDAENDIKALL